MRGLLAGGGRRCGRRAGIEQLRAAFAQHGHPTTNTSGQQNSHSFRANSSDFSRRWFIALTQDLALVPASAKFKEMLFCVKNG